MDSHYGDSQTGTHKILIRNQLFSISPLLGRRKAEVDKSYFLGASGSDVFLRSGQSEQLNLNKLVASGTHFHHGNVSPTENDPSDPLQGQRRHS